MVGDLDFKTLYTEVEINDIDKTPNPDSAWVISLNKNINLVVYYASTNLAIAKAEAYLKPVTRQEWVGWDNNFNPIYKEVKDFDIDFRMIFADKSKSTMESYFNDGFTQLTTSMNTFIKELNTAYGWSIENVK